MRIIRFTMLSAAATLILAGTSFAAGMILPRVEYSADSIMQSQGGEFRSKVFQSYEKQRIEMNQGGGRQVMILRADKKVAWVLMPEQKMYMEMSLKEAQKKSRDMNSCSMRQKSLGGDTVNGFRTTKSSVSMSCPDGFQYEGTLWATKDGIMMKMDAVAKGEGEGARIRTELKNLKIARQNPALFEVPADYRKMNMEGGFAGMLGSMMKNPEDTSGDGYGTDSRQAEDTGRAGSSQPRLTGRAPSTQQREYGRAPSSQKREPDAIDTVKKLKGLFGW